MKRLKSFQGSSCSCTRTLEPVKRLNSKPTSEGQ